MLSVGENRNQLIVSQYYDFGGGDSLLVVINHMYVTYFFVQILRTGTQTSEWDVYNCMERVRCGSGIFGTEDNESLSYGNLTLEGKRKETGYLFWVNGKG